MPDPSAYPFNPAIADLVMQTDVSGVNVDRGFIAHLSLTAAQAVAASAAGVVAATTLPTSGTTTVTSGITNPAVPRSLSIVGNQAGITGTVVINGTAYDGSVIQESIVANGTTTVNSLKAFKTVTSVVFPTRNGAGDTISVGWGNKIGLPNKLSRNSVIPGQTYLGNAREGTEPTVTVSASDISLNTVLLNSALNGSAVDIHYIV